MLKILRLVSELASAELALRRRVAALEERLATVELLLAELEEQYASL